jgi:hypothetical protein
MGRPDQQLSLTTSLEDLMAIPAYQPGEHVRATIDGRVHSVAGVITTITFGRGETLIPLDTGDNDITIARVAPADGEPQPGELWTDRHGTEWYAARCPRARGESMVYLYAPDGRAYWWPDVHTDDQLGPIRRVRPATPAPAASQNETAVL